MITIRIDEVDRFKTPQKCVDFKVVTANSTAATVSTSASHSPLPLSPVNLNTNFMSPCHLDDDAIYSLSPESLRRANLMTLVVDQDYTSHQHATRTNTWRQDKRYKRNSDIDDDQPPVNIDRVLQVMVKSTNRMLDDAQNDITKEINREYSLPFDMIHSSSKDEEEEELRHEIRKVKHTEETFRHELNFAIDKIAYRHFSTRDWATEMNLIADPAGQVSDANNSENRNDGQYQRWIEKMMNFLCCNPSYGGTDVS